MHKYLGLVTGIVVFIVSITGCMWSFKDEIESAMLPEFKIDANNSTFISPEEAAQSALKVHPNHIIHGVIYKTALEPLEVVFYQAEPEFYSTVFVHPATGEVLYERDHLSGFFNFALKGHQFVWLPPSIGEHVVDFSVLFFLFIVISGIVIYWPKTKKGWKRINFRWNQRTQWKRKIVDLHTIFGFYVSLIAFVLAFTGSIMAFNWFYYITYKSVGGDKDPRFVIPPTQAPLTQSETHYETIIQDLQQSYPNHQGIEFHFPSTDTSGILVEVFNSKGLYYNMDYLFFDQNTYKQLPVNSIYGHHKDADFADVLIRGNYDIHVGSIGGILGKIIAFIASLITASLPVTGIWMWYNKSKRKK